MSNDIIPKTAAEALRKWDNGDSVFSVEMGGLGPGYEMAIQGLAFEIIRALIPIKPKRWNDKQWQSKIMSKLEPIIAECDRKPWGGFSGAQVSVAKSLAGRVCKIGFRKALREDVVKDRLIQVCKKDLRQ